MSSARSPNLPRSSGPQTSSHAWRPIRRSIQARAVIRSYGARSPAKRWSASTAAPIRTRAAGDSGPKRSRSSGVTNGCSAPRAKNATLDGRHSIASGIPSSANRSAMWVSEVKRWW